MVVAVGCLLLAVMQLAELVASGDGPCGAVGDAMLELGAAWVRGSSRGTRSLDLFCKSFSLTRFIFSEAPIRSRLALLRLLFSTS